MASNYFISKDVVRSLLFLRDLVESMSSDSSFDLGVKESELLVDNIHFLIFSLSKFKEGDYGLN